jgi:hypothetical protein
MGTRAEWEGIDSNRTTGMNVKLPRLIDARYLSGYSVWICFDDGASGDIDLESELQGPVFEPLKNVDVFRRFRVHDQLHTLVWPNGADFAPEFLRAKLGPS